MAYYSTPQPKAWKPKDWGKATCLSRATVARLIAARLIKSTTVGRARLILTSPEDFLAAREAESAA
jgi:hypothetical protein